MYCALSWLTGVLARVIFLVAVSVALVAPTARAVRAQVPKTVKIIVPFPAGGSADILGRVLAEQIGKANGPTMVIENRPGRGTRWKHHRDHLQLLRHQSAGAQGRL
jgi:hypothetical protein